MRIGRIGSKMQFKSFGFDLFDQPFHSFL